MPELEGDARRIMDLLLQHRGDGMTVPELATALGLSAKVVKAELHRLRDIDCATKDPARSQRNGSLTWFADQIGIDRGFSDRFSAKMRKCLGGCEKMFMSEHAGNRICESCNEKERLETAAEELAA